MKKLKNKSIFKILLYILITIVAYSCFYFLGYTFDSHNNHIFIENCTGYSEYFFLPLMGSIYFGIIIAISFAITLLFNSLFK